MTTEIQKKLEGEITFNDVQNKIITIQNKNVLLDSDVAWLYSVETKRVNEAVNNNLAKFPEGYIIPLDKDEWNILKSKFSTSNEEVPPAQREEVLSTFLQKNLVFLIEDLCQTMPKLVCASCIHKNLRNKIKHYARTTKH